MKKSIYTVVAFAVFAASALASPVTDLQVKVPFAFKAGGSVLPAGTYTVTELNSGYILIRGDKGGVFVPRSSVLLDTDESGKTSVNFNRAGDKYVLQSVRSEK